MQAKPNRSESNRDDSLPQPLSNFMDLMKDDPQSSAKIEEHKMSSGSKQSSLLETSDHIMRDSRKMQESDPNMNNLQGLTTLIRAPSFGGQTDIQPAKDYQEYIRQGVDPQYGKQGTMSSSGGMSGNGYMSSSNNDYVLSDPMGIYYNNQKNVDSQPSSVKTSAVLHPEQQAPVVFVRGPSSKIVVNNGANLNDSNVREMNRIDPSPLGLKSPFFDHSENPSPFPNINQSMKPMLGVNGNQLGGKFLETQSPMPLKTPTTVLAPAPDLRARGGIYALQPKFETLQESASVVEIYNLCKEFDLLGRTEKVKALSEVNLNEDSDYYPIKKGEFVMIRGPSGGGKTTFLNLIGTADVASSGRLVIMGSEITEKSNDKYLSRLRLEKIGFVFQTFNLLATMSAYENVELPMKLLGKLNTKQIKQRTIELLTKVGLQDRMDHLPSEMSGGEQQRVAIARALSNTPEIILLDEPTGDLDTRSTVEVMNLLLSINNFGYTSDQTKSTMIMVTHNPDLECYADRIIYFRDGKIVKQVINEVQTPLEYDAYLKFLNANNNE